MKQEEWNKQFGFREVHTRNCNSCRYLVWHDYPTYALYECDIHEDIKFSNVATSMEYKCNDYKRDGPNVRYVPKHVRERLDKIEKDLQKDKEATLADMKQRGWPIVYDNEE